MLINACLAKISADDNVVLANNRQILAFKKTWWQQRGTSALPKVFSWQQYLQHTWRDRYSNTSKRLILEIESRILISQAMSDLGQMVDNRLLDEVVKNIDYCHAHLISIERLLQSHGQNYVLFAGWMKYYQQAKLERGLVDMNDLSTLIINHSAEIMPITIYGFKTLTPEQSRLFEHIGYQTLEAKQPNHTSQNQAFKTTDDEILHAAQWAKNLHQEHPDKHIVIVSPTLSSTQYQIKSIFDQVFNNVLVETGHKSYNISLGLSLTQYPLIQHIFQLLELLQQLQRNHIDTTTFNAVITSPYIANATSERYVRSTLVNRVLSQSKTHFKRKDISQYLLNTPQLKHLIDTTLTGATNTRQSHEKWLLDFNAYLQAWGFATDRVLSSVEYQLLKKYQQSSLGLNQLAQTHTKVSAAKALSDLKKWLSQVVFQAQSAKTPIQILGSLEAQGLYFDAAWVLGVTDDFLPAGLNSPRFIPSNIAAQHQIPHSSFELINTDTNNTLKNLINLADTVICSYAKIHFQDQQQASPLLEFDAEISILKRQHQPEVMQNLTDTQSINLLNTCVRGGVSILKDQMTCAFKGFTHRLKIENFEAPHIGLNRAQQGDIIHKILEKIYSQMPTHIDLVNCTENDLDNLINSNIKRVLSHYPPSFFIQVEQTRLSQLIKKFINIEKQRNNFNVLAIEEKIEVNINGLKFSTRVDRIDELDNGERIIFDYKTGNIPSNPWCGEPIKEPQLPIYAMNNQTDGIAFIHITADKISYKGLAKDADSLPNKTKQQRSCAQWDEQLQHWKQQLNQSSSDYQSGKAAVLPSKYACIYCQYDPLCRVQK